MDFQKFCAALTVPEAAKAELQKDWDNILAAWDGKPPFFMDIEFFKEYYPFCHGPYTLDELLPFAEKVIEITRTAPEAALYAHIVHYSTFQLKSRVDVSLDKDVIGLFGEKYSGMFAFMISLGVCPFAAKSYAELGLPEHYAIDMRKWLGGTMYAYAEAHPGCPGRPFQFFWLRCYVEKTLFRIGRLEYYLHPWKEFLPAIYRNRQGEIAVLSGHGWQFRNNRRRIDSGETPAFTTWIKEDENTITGMPVYSDGTVDFDNPRTLEKSQWYPVASPWDLCPSIHIPGGSRMSFEDVKSSMMEAAGFFLKYFNRRVPLFGCCSWILNPAWETFLENSNMARFRRECYASPGASWGPLAGMSFLFGRQDVPPDTLTPKNTAQKAFIEAYKQNQIGTGVIFVMTEDIPAIGNEFYRKKYPAPDKK